MTTSRSLIAVLPALIQTYAERLRTSPVGYRLAAGAFWSIVGEAPSRILAMLTSFVLARALGITGFGELGIIQSTVGMFGTLAGFGLGMTATKYVAQFRTSEPGRAGSVIAISTIVSLVSGAALTLLLIAIGPFLAQRTLAAPHLAPMLQVSSLLLLFGAIGGAQTGALAGFEAFRRLAGINLWTAVITFALMVGATLWWGLIGAIWASVVSRIVHCILSYRAVLREAAAAGIAVTYQRPGRDWTIVTHYSVPALMSGLLFMGVYWVCNTMLVNTNSGYAQMGVFNAANQWFNTIVILPLVLGQAVLPVLSERLASGSKSQSSKVLRFSMGLNAAVTVPAAIIGSLLSPFIMAGYGSEFRSAWPTLVLVFAAASLSAVQAPIGHIIAASGRMWLGSAMNLGWGIVFIALTWLLLERGAQGLALARLVAYAAHMCWTLPFAAHLLSQSDVDPPRYVRPDTALN